ncbi:hypothetical protein BUALT_Bualt16G0057600 [Buddleja alternifolia]|uniref:PABC domain-containing protein n=1 Tax=Buddleja alternifolia TaxID=168488 RepID=A0AAV6WA11_9LAMI|nr:hypothetical protein BUALT_Bualt16G0057600 [Buddleja alternifolia]
MLQAMPGRLYRHPPTANYDADNLDLVLIPLDWNGMSHPNPVSIVESIFPFSEPNEQLALLTLITSEGQRTVLGENLYPFVEELEHDNAPKVTGMLLELPHMEILHLLRSPDALSTKVAEALEAMPGRLYRHPPTANYDADNFDLVLNPLDWNGMPHPNNPVSIVESIFPFSETNEQLALLTLITPEGQRTVLGENLYPLVEELEHDNAPKVTGMLLELPHMEILHLLRSPDALSA